MARRPVALEDSPPEVSHGLLHRRRMLQGVCGCLCADEERRPLRCRPRAAGAGPLRRGSSGVRGRGARRERSPRGFFTAHDARTGEEIYSRQRIAVGAAFTASPWAYDDRISALTEDGDTYVVIRAGETFEVIGRNPLGEFTMATPAIAHGSLFIRTRSKLYRIAEAEAP